MFLEINVFFRLSFASYSIVILLRILMQSYFLPVLMQSIREDIEKEHHAIQKNDVIVFFQVAQFVTSFQHHKFLNSKVRREFWHVNLCICFHILSHDSVSINYPFLNPI